MTAPVKTIGITCPDKQHPAINRIFPGLNALYRNEIQRLLKENGYSVVSLVDSLSFGDPGKSAVMEICSKANLDGLIIARITFTHVTNYIYFVPTSKYYDNILELQFVDREGVSRIIVKHNTANDVYGSVPENDVIIKKSIDKSTGQMLKEMKR
jgi:hypothetical protein